MCGSGAAQTERRPLLRERYLILNRRGDNKSFVRYGVYEREGIGVEHEGSSASDRLWHAVGRSVEGISEQRVSGVGAVNANLVPSSRRGRNRNEGRVKCWESLHG